MRRQNKTQPAAGVTCKQGLRWVSRRRLAGPLLSLVATLLALAVAEIVVRVASLAPDVKPIDIAAEHSVYKRSSNPILGIELKANYRDDDPDLHRSYPHTNSHGQRDIERSIDKPHGVRRIILLGDSVVEGDGIRIRQVDDLISRQLEMLYGDGTQGAQFRCQRLFDAGRSGIAAGQGAPVQS